MIGHYVKLASKLATFPGGLDRNVGGLEAFWVLKNIMICVIKMIISLVPLHLFNALRKSVYYESGGVYKVHTKSLQDSFYRAAHAFH